MSFLSKFFISNNLEVNEIRRAIVNFYTTKKVLSEVELPQILEKWWRMDNIIILILIIKM